MSKIYYSVNGKLKFLKEPKAKNSNQWWKIFLRPDIQMALMLVFVIFYVIFGIILIVNPQVAKVLSDILIIEN